MKKVLLLLLAVAHLAACNEKEFTTTPDGLKYKMLLQTGGEKPKPGDLLDLVMVVHTEKDSVFFDSRTTGGPIKLTLSEPTFKGGMEEGFAMMAAGDSALFVIPADSFFLKTSQEPFPDFLKKGSKLKFTVKLEKWQTMEQFRKESTELMDSKRSGEEAALAKYISDNNIAGQPTATGLYYVEKLAGTGEKATVGKTVKVHYTGKLVDGTVFDSSVGKTPLEFQLGTRAVIAGWEEGISMMREGGKATLVMGSGLAYGRSGYGNKIGPYEPLVFEVELISVK